LGSSVTAVCNCGVTEDILVGGGAATFTTTCYFPCLCRKCRKVVQVNLFTSKKRCPACKTPGAIPYDAPELAGLPGSGSVVEWNTEDTLGRSLALSDGTYECPACGKMSLHFSDGGMLWD
jgi:hypothetical protein